MALDLACTIYCLLTIPVLCYFWLELKRAEAVSASLAESVRGIAKELTRIERKLDGLCLSIRADLRYVDKLSNELMNRLLTMQGEMKSTHTIIPGSAPQMADPLAAKLQEDFMEILGVHSNGPVKNPDDLV
jgi:hypothetical protein